MKIAILQESCIVKAMFTAYTFICYSRSICYHDIDYTLNRNNLRFIESLKFQ
jgi:hypothetical protein